MDRALAQAIIDALDECGDVRVIVLTGTDPAFCAGMDLRELGAHSLAEVPSFMPALARSPVPIIAAVNGPAVTAGLEIALMCDFILASDRACFADTHLRVGVYPGPVALELPRRVGSAMGREILFGNQFVDAPTALRIGLVNRVVPHDELLASAVGLASAIAENDPVMLQLLRAQLNESGRQSAEQARVLHARYAADAVSATTKDQLASRHAGLIDREVAARAGAMRPASRP